MLASTAIIATALSQNYLFKPIPLIFPVTTVTMIIATCSLLMGSHFGDIRENKCIKFSQIHCLVGTYGSNLLNYVCENPLIITSNDINKRP